MYRKSLKNCIYISLFFLVSIFFSDVLLSESTPFDHDGFRYIYNADHHYWEYYSPKNKKIANIVWFDNGPDYYSEDLRRIIENKKYGFINKKNQIIIKPQFDWAEPFYNGYARVANNVIFKRDSDKHLLVTKGKWGLINLNGKIIVPLEYNQDELNFACIWMQNIKFYP